VIKPGPNPHPIGMAFNLNVLINHGFQDIADLFEDLDSIRLDHGLP
jgi:hypothetical protein